jgi:hypothetical protein
LIFLVETVQRSAAIERVERFERLLKPFLMEGS